MVLYSKKFQQTLSTVLLEKSVYFSIVIVCSLVSFAKLCGLLCVNNDTTRNILCLLFVSDYLFVLLSFQHLQSTRDYKKHNESEQITWNCWVKKCAFPPLKCMHDRILTQWKRPEIELFKEDGEKNTKKT